MRVVTTFLVSVVICLVVAPLAPAAEVDAQDPSRWVRVKANDGELNRLTISRADTVVTVADAGADVVAGKGCEQVDPREVKCAITDGEPRVDVTLGDGDDEATALGTVPVKLDGGAGNDTLNGGLAADRLDGGEGNDTFGARDGIRDDVACGGGQDAGEADVEDNVAEDCESVGKPLPPPNALVDDVSGPKPAPGKSVAAGVKSGTVLVRTPGAESFVALDPSRPVPVGTVFDTSDGTLTLTTAADQSGGTQTADFTGGSFAVAQQAAVTMTTELQMRGGSFSSCAAAATRGAVARAASRRVVRKLWGSGKGRFRTRGRHAAATVRGTVWEVVDRCNGTLTRVRKGIVVVENLRTRRTKVVRAGESFFVRRRAQR